MTPARDGAFHFRLKPLCALVLSSLAAWQSEALAEAGAPAANVRFATLIDNAVSTVRVDYRARTIDRRVTKDWFVFPWEAVASEDAIAHDAAEVPDRIA